MKKKLTTLTLSGLMIGPILGSGIILLPPIVYSMVGNLSFIAWLIILVFGFAFALVLGDLSIKFPGDEGVTNAVEAAFSKKLKYLTSYYLISAVFFGPVAVYYVGAHFIQPLLGWDVNLIAFLLLFITCITLLRPVHFLGKLSLVVTTLVGIILSFGSLAVLLSHPIHVSVDTPFEFLPFSKALLLAFWAIVGWEVIGNYSNEVEKPRNSIPKAVKISAFFISVIYLLVISAIQFTSMHESSAITALIYPLFGSISVWIMGILALLLCMSTVLLFVGGVSRLISGLTTPKTNLLKHLSHRLENGAPIGAILFLCTMNMLVILLVSKGLLNTQDLVSLADGFFIANASIALLAAYKLAETKFIRYTALILTLLFCLVLLSSHWLVLVIMAVMAIKVLT